MERYSKSNISQDDIIHCMIFCEWGFDVDKIFDPTLEEIRAKIEYCENQHPDKQSKLSTDMIELYDFIVDMHWGSCDDDYWDTCEDDY